MFDKIIAFFMSIIAFFASLFGINIAKVDSFEDVSYGENSRQVLDLCIPEDNDGTLGLILMIHGGAWIEGDKSAYDSNLEAIAKDYGYAAAAINYRYLSEDVTMADILDDIEAAVAKIKEMGTENGVNIDKVLLTGHSAGAHLAMLYAYSRAETSAIKPTAVVSFAGPTDLTNEEYWTNALGAGKVAQLLTWATGKNITNTEDLVTYRNEILAISPINYVDKAVPTVIAHGAKDSIVPYQNALDIVNAFDAAGAKYDFVSYPNSDHDLASDSDSEDKTYLLYVEYAKAYLK